MSENSPYRLKCPTIAYRQGFIEVTPKIHNGLAAYEHTD